jgi:hypothetical protein
MTVFVMGGVARDVPLRTIFRGIVPFLYADLVRVGLLILFPGIALFPAPRSWSTAAAAWAASIENGVRPCGSDPML